MEPRYSYPVLILGSNTAPPDLVAAKLDTLLSPRLADRLVVLAGRDAKGDITSTSHEPPLFYKIPVDLFLVRI